MSDAKDFFLKEAQHCELLANQTNNRETRANFMLLARHYRQEAEGRAKIEPQPAPQGTVFRW